MNLFRVIPYHSNMQSEWDNLVSLSENGNFLFHRAFMEYHSDRFSDHSLAVFKDDVLMGIFPANIREKVIYSHQGLTYGGLILPNRKGMKNYLGAFYALLEYCREKGITEMVYKPVPGYLCRESNDTEHFIMNCLGALVTRVDTGFNIDTRKELKFQERRRRSVKKGQKSGALIKGDNNFELFWNRVLIPNLKEKFGTTPVHSLAEINKLHNSFPDKITQVNAFLEDKPVAGVTLFDFDHTLHCQYISSTDEGRSSGAIDHLFDHLIEVSKSQNKNFSLGTANNNGNDLNLGLCDWKEGWGASVHAHFHYRFSLEDISQLKKFTE